MSPVTKASERLVLTDLGAGIWALAALCLGGPACNGPPPSEPSPVIITTPTTVCLDDEYKTPITLDGTQSSSMLTLVPAPNTPSSPPLTFLWTLTGSKYDILGDAGDASLTSDKLTVTMAGDQPLQVELEVTNAANGGTASTTATISVTPPNDAGVCPLGNPG
jgi:hypothetical protein